MWPWEGDCHSMGPVFQFVQQVGWTSSLKDAPKDVPKIKIPQGDRHILTSLLFLPSLLSADTAHIPRGREDWPCSLWHGQGKAGVEPRRAFSRKPICGPLFFPCYGVLSKDMIWFLGSLEWCPTIHLSTSIVRTTWLDPWVLCNRCGHWALGGKIEKGLLGKMWPHGCAWIRSIMIRLEAPGPCDWLLSVYICMSFFPLCLTPTLGKSGKPLRLPGYC
jgi:hypothetical protein